MRGIGLVLAGLLLALPALAADKKPDPWASIMPVGTDETSPIPPRLDVEGLCDRQARLWDRDNPSAQILLSCQRQQQGAYDILKSRWGAYPVPIKEKCLAISLTKNASGGSGDYDILLNCIVRELKAASDAAQAAKFKFKD
jgi:hypothetical protein